MERAKFDPNWRVPGSNKTQTVLIAASDLNYGVAVTHALKYDHIIVSGNNATVGLGGYIQGGGHGPLSSTFSLAADNIYQVRVVTTQGHILTADATQNQGLSISPLGNSSAACEASWKALAELLHHLPDLMDAGMADAVVVATTERLVQTTVDRLRAAAGNNSRILSVSASNTTVYPTDRSFFKALNAGGSNQAGAYSMPSSHLLGRRELSQPSQGTLVGYLTRILTNTNPNDAGMAVFGLQGGPGPANTPKSMRGALLSAWRSTYLHAMGYSLTFDTTLAPEEQLQEAAEDLNGLKEKL
uniref:WGS project CBMG000000000 data, contig CS5907-c003690 n=1 Tax=Fusarium acuminatum CS5907 TaxID=1318461 RepID=A0A090MGB2_9HYPO|nr:unnamed protein product [Fusarium acuminatum CS5907]